MQPAHRVRQRYPQRWQLALIEVRRMPMRLDHASVGPGRHRLRLKTAPPGLHCVSSAVSGINWLAEASLYAAAAAGGELLPLILLLTPAVLEGATSSWQRALPTASLWRERLCSSLR